MSTLATVAIQNLPGLIGFLKAAFQRQNPSAPVPTDEDVILAYQQALASSLARDADWLAAHGSGIDPALPDDVS